MKAKKIVALMLALVMVLALGTSALAATGDMSNPVTVSGVTLRFGDPNYPATAPEKYMYFKETGTGTYDAIYSTDGTTEDTSYYPDILALYISGSVTSITGSDMIFVTYDADGTPTESETTTVNTKNFYTIKPQSDNSTITVNGNVTVSFSAPNVQIAEGSNPAAVTGYLPVGQFARYNSFGWGTLYTDNTNIKSTSNTTKFLDGYVSTGVSLGMAGGYIQFDMGTRPIMNDAKNRYGIDFIVYGNAFVGNSIEEVAKKAGMDPKKLAHSARMMTEYAKKGHDDQFGKDPKFLRKVDKAPFYIVRGKLHALASASGVRVTEFMEVVDKDDHVIPGLYAIGHDAGGFYGDTYDLKVGEGSASSFAINGGRIAVKNILGEYDEEKK